MPYLFFFQAEDGIRDLYVTGVQTCALPIFHDRPAILFVRGALTPADSTAVAVVGTRQASTLGLARARTLARQIGRASCRERVWISAGEGAAKRQSHRSRGCVQ